MGGYIKLYQNNTQCPKILDVDLGLENNMLTCTNVVYLVANLNSVFFSVIYHH